MKPLTVSIFIICFVLIGILPTESEHNLAPHLPPLVTEAVSAGQDFLPGLSEEPEETYSRDLATGQELFNQVCSGCHSVGFVWKARLFSSEAEKLVERMLQKDRPNVDPEQRELLLCYLISRLPTR
ncbi:MAG TPA: cytochrome c [Candidatus Glassbacteria bacterium]|nr:cytochrome c [Candidatus Glassbacteria bacterium]